MQYTEEMVRCPPQAISYIHTMLDQEAEWNIKRTPRKDEGLVFELSEV